MNETQVVHNLMDILESLTPGGSEFHNNPKMCETFIRDQLSSRMKVAKERNELRKENVALRAALAELTTAVEEGDPQAIADAVGHYRGAWDNDPAAGELPGQ